MPKKKVADPTAPPRRSSRLNRVPDSPAPSLTGSELSEPPAVEPPAVEPPAAKVATPKDPDAIDEVDLDAAEKEHQAALAAKKSAMEAKDAKKAAKEAAANKKKTTVEKAATAIRSRGDTNDPPPSSPRPERDLTPALDQPSIDFSDFDLPELFKNLDNLDDREDSVGSAHLSDVVKQDAGRSRKRKTIVIDSEDEDDGYKYKNAASAVGVKDKLLKPKPAKKPKLNKDAKARKATEAKNTAKVARGAITIQRHHLLAPATDNTLSMEEVYAIVEQIKDADDLLAGGEDKVDKPERLYDLFVGRGVRLPTYPRLLKTTEVLRDFNVTDISEVSNEQMLRRYRCLPGEPVLFPPSLRPGTFVNEAVTSIWETISALSNLFILYPTPCSCCERAGNAACFYDVRLGTKSCARCVRSHRDCSLKVQHPRALAQAAVHQLEGAARAGNAEPAWVQSMSDQFRANRL